MCGVAPLAFRSRRLAKSYSTTLASASKLVQRAVAFSLAGAPRPNARRRAITTSRRVSASDSSPDRAGQLQDHRLRFPLLAIGQRAGRAGHSAQGGRPGGEARDVIDRVYEGDFEGARASMDLAEQKTAL